MSTHIGKIMKLTYLLVTCLSVLTDAESIASGVLNTDGKLEEKVPSDVPKSCACGGRRDSLLSAAMDDNLSFSETVHEEVPIVLISDDHIHHNKDVYDSGNESNDTFGSKVYSNARNSSMNSYESNLENMVYIEGGSFHMGTDSPQIATDGEGPRRLVTLSSYMIDR
jgi:formylglycine-generating enzyme required for sulfatase activity